MSDTNELNPLEDFKKDIYGNKLSYLNNTNLKSKDQQLGFTQDHVKELYKCSKDIFYFAENY